MKSNYKYIVRLLVLILLLTPQALLAQNKIRVQGVVRDMENNPIYGVNVIFDGAHIGFSDEDGKFVITALPNAELLFYKSGFNDLKVKVDNRQVLEVIMEEKVIEIGEVLVVGKMSSKKILVDKSDLEVIGNNFHLKTKFRVPKNIFNSEKRFIVQPTLYNATTKKYRYFRPVVIDGRLYKANKSRVDEFDSEKDLLSNYLVENTLAESDNIYAYKDSIFVKKELIEQDYRAECYLAVNLILERPHKDYLDTIVIARGTKNPLRFLEYQFAPLELVDTTLIPKPEFKLMSEAGVTRIGFIIGKAAIDTSNPNNQRELDAITDKIQNIIADEFSTLQSISVTGYASPEGVHSSNVKLAKERTKLILNEVTASLNEAQKDFIKLSSASFVEPWSRLAEFLERDSLPIAGKVRDIVTSNKDHYDHSGWQIRRLPEYRSVIVNKYLPELRRVEYTLNYSIFRNLTDSEILRRYNSEEEDISRYEYWRLIESAKNQKTKENFEEIALSKYPNFTLIANRLAVRLLKSDSLSLDVLSPCINERTPFEVTYNQSITALGLGEMELADSLISTIAQDNRTSYLNAIVSALNGDYEKAYPLIASKGGLNEVLILLCMDRNKDANEKIKSMLNDPIHVKNAKVWYVRAVCANRNDDLMWAMEGLKRAIDLDSSLEDLARLDSDLIDIIDIIKPKYNL